MKLTDRMPVTNRFGGEMRIHFNITAVPNSAFKDLKRSYYSFTFFIIQLLPFFSFVSTTLWSCKLFEIEVKGWVVFQKNSKVSTTMALKKSLFGDEAIKFHIISRHLKLNLNCWGVFPHYSQVFLDPYCFFFEFAYLTCLLIKVLLQIN